MFILTFHEKPDIRTRTHGPLPSNPDKWVCHGVNHRRGPRLARREQLLRLQLGSSWEKDHTTYVRHLALYPSCCQAQMPASLLNPQGNRRSRITWHIDIVPFAQPLQRRLRISTFLLWQALRGLCCADWHCVRRRLIWLLNGRGVFARFLCGRRLLTRPLLSGRPEGLLRDIAGHACTNTSVVLYGTYT